MNSETTSLISILVSMALAGGTTLALYMKGNLIEKKVFVSRPKKIGVL